MKQSFLINTIFYDIENVQIFVTTYYIIKIINKQNYWTKLIKILYKLQRALFLSFAMLFIQIQVVLKL